MIENYGHIIPDVKCLEESLLGRVVRMADLNEGKIYFLDGSVLCVTYCPENAIGIAFEFFEKPKSDDV